MVAGPQPGGPQRPGQLVGTLIELPVGGDLAGARHDDGRAVGMFGRPRAEVHAVHRGRTGDSVRHHGCARGHDLAASWLRPLGITMPTDWRC